MWLILGKVDRGRDCKGLTNDISTQTCKDYCVCNGVNSVLFVLLFSTNGEPHLRLQKSGRAGC